MAVRRKYNPAFKAQAVALAESSGKSNAEIEQDLGISSGLLSKWRRQARGAVKQGISEVVGLSPTEAELHKIRRELALGREERDILKKTIGILSNQR